MGTVFLLLSSISFCLLIIGLVKPDFLKFPSRKRVAVLFGLPFVIFFIIAGYFLSSSFQKSSTRSSPYASDENLSLIADYVGTDAPDKGDRYQTGKYSTEHFTGNGVGKILILKNSYDDITVWVDGGVGTMGTYRNGCDSQYDGCYDFENKRYYFNVPPQAGANVVVKGFPVSSPR